MGDDALALGTAAIAAENAPEILKQTHKTLANVDEMISQLRFNSAIAQIHALVNGLELAKRQLTPNNGTLEKAVFVQCVRTAVQMFAPMMPHLAEECWKVLDGREMVACVDWPVADRELYAESQISLPVQINGKKRGEVMIDVGADKQSIEKLVLEQGFVQNALSGNTPKKLVIVPQRIVNVVV